MEEIIEINGIRYKRMDESKNKKEYKIGDIVYFNSYDWYIMKIDNDIATLVMKECLPKETVLKYWNEIDVDGDVKFSINNSYDFDKSNLKAGLMKFAKAEFPHHLRKMKINYDEDKYCESFMRVPTIREVEKFTTEMHNIEHKYGYWTMSPYGLTSDGVAHVFFVYGSTYPGYLSHYYVSNSVALRPVISVKVDVLNKKSEVN